MKRVSFKVAKAIKEAGYPQEYKGYRYTTKKCRGRYVGSQGNNAWYEFDEGELVDGNRFNLFHSSSAYAPTYLDVWLWLWREKKIAIGCPYENTYNYWFTNINADNDKSFILWKFSSGESKDPEEAIIAAIEYLVENDLIR